MKYIARLIVTIVILGIFCLLYKYCQNLFPKDCLFELKINHEIFDFESVIYLFVTIFIFAIILLLFFIGYTIKKGIKTKRYILFISFLCMVVFLGLLSNLYVKHQYYSDKISEKICLKMQKGDTGGYRFNNLNIEEYDYINKILHRFPELPSSANEISLTFDSDILLGDSYLKMSYLIPIKQIIDTGCIDEKHYHRCVKCENINLESKKVTLIEDVF